MNRYDLNSDTLRQVGVGLLPGEQVEVAVQLENGLTEELELSQATLVLTNRRLMRYSAGSHRVNVISVGLDDVDSIKVNRSERHRQWVWVGAVFVLGGVILGLVTLILIGVSLSPLLMALSLGLIGVVFLLTYFGGLMGEVIVRAGQKDVKCKMRQKALDDMGVFVKRYYELRLGHSGGGGGSDTSARPTGEVEGVGTAATASPSPEG